MRAFLKNIILFLSPLAILLGYSEYFLRNMPSEYSMKKQQLLELADSIELLILGNSHAGDGINPNLLFCKAFNLAHGTQSIYFDRRLTEKYMPALPQLKYVLISADYHSLYFEHKAERDFFYHLYHDIQFKGKSYLKESLLRTFFVYPPKTILSLMHQERQLNLRKGWNNNDPPQAASLTLESGKETARLFNDMVKAGKHHREAVLKELDSLFLILRSKNIEPVLITCPAHKTCGNHLDKNILEEDRKAIRVLCNSYGVKYLDFLYDTSFNDSDFYNPDHLNSKGAAKLAGKINKVLSDRHQGR